VKVLVDVTPAIPGKSGSVGAFRNMMRLLPDENSELELFILASHEQQAYYEKYLYSEDKDRIVFIEISKKSFSTFRRIIAQNILIPKICKDKKIDIFFSFNPEPLISFRRTKEIFKIVDLQFLESPHEFHFRKRIYRRIMGQFKVRKASLIIANSYYTKTQIVKHYPHAKNKIRVIYEAFDNQLFNTRTSLNTIKNNLRNKYGIDKGYILYVSSFRPYKNHLLALEAYKILMDRGKISHDLIFIGNDINNYKKSIEEKILINGLENKVKIFNFVHHSELPMFYRCADLTIYPSEFETFGIPPLESMACGTPVIANKSTAIPEICGEAAILIDVKNIPSFAEAIEHVLLDDNLANLLKEKGILHCSSFCWEKNVHETYVEFTNL